MTRLRVILLAPVEIIGCAMLGARDGIRDALANIVEAWRQAGRREA